MAISRKMRNLLNYFYCNQSDPLFCTWIEFTECGTYNTNRIDSVAEQFMWHNKWFEISLNNSMSPNWACHRDMAGRIDESVSSANIFIFIICWMPWWTIEWWWIYYCVFVIDKRHRRCHWHRHRISCPWETKCARRNGVRARRALHKLKLS